MKKKNALSKFALSSAHVFLVGLVSYAIMFLFNLLAARYFGPEKFGLYSLSFTILLLCGLFSGLGLASGIPRFIPIYNQKGEHEKISTYKNFILRIVGVSSLLFCVAVFVLSKEITLFFQFPFEFVYYLKIISFGIPIWAIWQVYIQLLIAKKQAVFAVLGNELVQKSVLFLGLLTILTFGLGIDFLIFALILSILLGFLFTYIAYLRKVNFSKKDKKLNSTDVTEWVAFSLPLFFNSLFEFMLAWTDNLVIGKIMDPTALGIYSVTFSFAMFVAYFRGSLSFIFLPVISEYYAKKDHENISYFFKKSSIWLLGLSFPIFLFFCFNAKQLLGTIYGESYGTGALSLIILSCGVMINLFTGLKDSILLLHKKTKTIFSIKSVVSILNLVLNIVLIPVVGIVGAAIASASALSIQAIIFLSLAKKYESLKFDIGSTFKVIVSGVFAILISQIIYTTALAPLFQLIASFVVFAFCYSVLVLLLGVLKSDDLDVLRDLEEKLPIKLTYVIDFLSHFVR